MPDNDQHRENAQSSQPNTWDGGNYGGIYSLLTDIHHLTSISCGVSYIDATPPFRRFQAAINQLLAIYGRLGDAQKRPPRPPRSRGIHFQWPAGLDGGKLTSTGRVVFSCIACATLARAVPDSLGEKRFQQPAKARRGAFECARLLQKALRPSPQIPATPPPLRALRPGSSTRNRFRTGPPASADQDVRCP